MGLDIRIAGIDEVLKLSRQIRATGDKGLGREMGKALGEAIKPVTEAIEASAAKTMPSGYAPTLTASLKHRRSQRTASRQASLRLTTIGEGTKEQRDLVRLNKGELRHPVFGRSRATRRGRRKNPWAVTSIKAGFHDRGVEDAGPEAEKRLGRVLDDFAERLAKG
jgi:hypothetical protein